ncbi:unnamed protein product [Vitrella brassicaformis CCMP3155]|uniref:Uncharacterized protein n=2 Tax=Vitrella brassicaformis TaxID=1169539 RepID=A0A0G4GDQ9_VITBC|nr:unnamed protein product [Vitrella brassicaformis CCMP3155]|eukprot:CEM27527.1 unnamed protein product [Vitrella brassicaformis CCMP3155]
MEDSEQRIKELEDRVGQLQAHNEQLQSYSAQIFEFYKKVSEDYKKMSDDYAAARAQIELYEKAQESPSAKSEALAPDQAEQLMELTSEVERLKEECHRGETALAEKIKEVEDLQRQLTEAQRPAEETQPRTEAPMNECEVGYKAGEAELHGKVRLLEARIKSLREQLKKRMRNSSSRTTAASVSVGRLIDMMNQLLAFMHQEAENDNNT